MSELEDLLRKTSKPSTAGTLVYIMFGPLIWAVHFTLIYGGHTLACGVGSGPAVAYWTVAAATVAAGSLLLWFLLRRETFARALGLPPGMPDRRAYDRFALIAAILSEVAILWAGAAAFFVSACEIAR